MHQLRIVQHHRRLGRLGAGPGGVAAGTSAIDLTGHELVNIVTGNAGSNVINGGAGNDTLRGNAGSDFFLFNTSSRRRPMLTGSTTSRRGRHIQLDDRIFNALTGNDPLAAGAFNTAGLALTRADLLVV